MKADEPGTGGSIFSRIRRKLSGERVREKSRVALNNEESATENLHILEEYEGIKHEPEQLTGWDFDRAFEFLEKYPESDLAAKLKEEMYGTNSSTLKGLSYASAMKVLQTMPDHPGVSSITSGLRKLEKDYIKELRSDIIAFILEVHPDHPLNMELTAALAEKNLTNAYDFIERLPDHPCTPNVIQAMFDTDANIATLLLNERMDHPQVASIFDGIYSIDKDAAGKMMPNAILFIMDVASDHRYMDEMVLTLVEKNYIKAFDFVKNNPDHPFRARIQELLIKRKAELKPLLS